MINERIYLDESDNRVYIDVYASSNCIRQPRPAIIIFPGGGYHGCSPREAEPIALAFIGRGYNCFVLNYRVGQEGDVYPKQLIDASRAILHIRENAEKYEIDPERVYVCGFSAGGHLAGSLAYMNSDERVISYLGIEQGANKPNAAILAYPVVTALAQTHEGSFKNLLGKPFDSITQEEREFYSLENHISEASPPTYIWHTAADKAVPVVGSLLLAERLVDHGVPVSLKVYTRGGHGLSLANEITATDNPLTVVPEVQGWIEDVDCWLKNL